MGQASHEPSMEDILASIKRIIAEDSEAVGVRPSRLRRESISAVQASPVVRRGTDPEVEPEGLPEDQPREDLADNTAGTPGIQQPNSTSEASAEEARIETAGATEGEAEPTVAAAPTEKPAKAPEDVLELTRPMPVANSDAQDKNRENAAAPKAGPSGIVSGQAATASRNAFAALSQLQVRNEEGQSNTLEGLVGDLLRPMLREWLDSELPALVERVVTAEVRRLSGSII